MSKAKAEKSLFNYYNMSFIGYSGVFLKESLMRKVAKLQYKQAQELKELLASNLDDLEVADWTLAYPNGEQRAVHFYDKNTSDEDKIERIKVLEHVCKVKHEKNVYEVVGSEWKGKKEAVIDAFMKMEDEK